jgi:outer membrane protein OmpA-like peptidoglycan-associated protein
MVRANSVTAVGLLVLGLADVLYLDLAVAPDLLREEPRRGPTAPPGALTATAHATAAVEKTPAPSPPPAPPADADEVTAVHVLFGRGGAALSATARAQLERLAERLAAEPWLRAEISGHVDGRGERDIGHQLSLRRAGRVAAFFESHGVPRAQMSVCGLGAGQPLDRGEDRHANRRAEVRVAVAAPERVP